MMKKYMKIYEEMSPEASKALCRLQTCWKKICGWALVDTTTVKTEQTLSLRREDTTTTMKKFLNLGNFISVVESLVKY